MYDLYIKINLLNLCLKITGSNEEIITSFKNKIFTIPSLQIVNAFQNESISVKITENYIEFSEPDLDLRWKGRLSSSDSFIFINALFYHLFYLKGFICLHSNAVITHNNKVILIAGDFGAGKSTLCHFCKEKGYRICAGDQAVVKIKNNELYFVSGSIIDKFDNLQNFLNYEDCNFIRPISKMLILNGMCDNGDLSITELTNLGTISKRTSNYLFWPYYTPVLSIQDNNFIKLYPENMTTYYQFWSAIKKLRLYRGDKRKIFEDIENGR